jgi:Ca2+-binding EF-hand superfamily protein
MTHQNKPTNIIIIMKTKTLTIIAAAALGLVTSVQAEQGKPAHGDHKILGEIIARFDKDGDGKLSKEERQEARAAHKQKMLDHFDKDENGELSAEEKKAMRGQMKKKMLDRFDKDGDGELSKEERVEMRRAFPRRPGGPQHRGKSPRPGKGGGDFEAPGAGL